LTGTADSHSPESVIPDDVLIQFGPPDDEHLLLETCRGIRNKYIKKECIKLVITQNRIYGILRFWLKTASSTSCVLSNITGLML
jgi:hypothetical protein